MMLSPKSVLKERSNFGKPHFGDVCELAHFSKGVKRNWQPRVPYGYTIF
jgi:hypothetical protein